MPAEDSEPMERSAQILTLPNLLSLLRLLAIPLVLLFMLERDLTWALIFFVGAGLTDNLDGLLARLLRQKTVFGMYLDPIADKLLISSSFLVLAITGEVPWLVTGLVLARDLAIILVAVVMMLATDIRQFPPTILGKANTSVQMAAILAVLLHAVYGLAWLASLRQLFVWATPVLAVASGLQYAYRTVRWLRERPGTLVAG